MNRSLQHAYPALTDLRVAILATIVWSCSAAWMSRSIPPVTVLWLSLGMLLAAVGLLAWYWHSPSRRGTRHLLPSGSLRLTLVLLALVCVCTIIRCDQTLTHYDTHPLHRLINERSQVHCQALILTHPTTGSYGHSRAHARLGPCTTATLHTERPLNAVIQGPAVGTYQRGAHVSVTGRLSPPPHPRPPTAAHLTLHLQHHYLPPTGLTHYANTVRSELRRSIQHAHPAVAALIPGIALGDKNGFTTDDEQAFRSASLSHLIVISGFHTGLIASVVAVVIPGRGILKMGFTALLLVLIVSIVGPGASAVRAAVMGIIGCLSHLRGSGGQAGAALGAAVIIMILWDPWVALSPGFALSVAATAGVIWPARSSIRRFQRIFPTHTRWGKLRTSAWSVFAISFWAQLSVVPIIALVGLPIAPWGLAANLAVAPIVVPLCIGALLITASVAWIPIMTTPLILLITPLARWVFAVAHAVAHQPYAQITISPFHALALVGLTVGLLLYRRWRLRK